MPRNGSGLFERVHNWVADAGAGIKILASRMDAEFDGIATALTGSVAKNGETTMTGHLPMGSNRITGLANGTARTDAASVAQLQDNTATYAVTGGSSNAYTLTPAPAITAYAAGQSFKCKASFTCTGAATMNVSGLGDKDIKKDVSEDLAANDIFIDQIIEITYDGTNWQLPGVGGGTGYNPVTGLYLVGAAAEQVDKSSDGTTFTAADPVYTGTPDIVSIVHNGTNFVVASGANGAPDATCKYTVNGSSYTAAATTWLTGVVITRLRTFSNGNIIAETNAAPSGELPFSTDSGANFTRKLAFSTGGAGPGARMGIQSNSALLINNASNVAFSSTTDAGVTWAAEQSHTGLSASNQSAVAILNNYCFVGNNLGEIGYKTLGNLTSTTLTSATSNLAAAAVLGFQTDDTNWLAWTGGSLATAVVAVPATWTSRTTAFFTTASMTGNIVGIAYGASRLVAATDTGDLAYSDDHGATWTKIDAANNPASGDAFAGIQYVNSTFFAYGDQGNLIASTLGSVFTAITNTFGTSTVKTFAGA